jgi:hypothetical protein
MLGALEFWLRERFETMDSTVYLVVLASAAKS